MQTTFTYNGVVVKDVNTEVMDFSSEKDSTSVDQVGVTCQHVFTGVVHAKQKDENRPESNDHSGVRLDDFRDELHDLLLDLSKDRRIFSLDIGGKNITTVYPGAIDMQQPADAKIAPMDQMDISNGPHVKVQVVKITAGVSAHIRFTITYLLPNCGSPGNNSLSLQGLRNFRFWINEYLDCRNWLTTRTFIGRLRVAHKNISPHALARVVTVPPLEPGFRRQVVKWEESSDGLHLDFTIQDQETIVSAPWSPFAGVGAIDWDGYLAASTDTFGHTGRIDFRVRLTGPKNTSKLQLIELAYGIADSKARLFEALQAAAVPNSVVVLESLTVTEQLAENVVEVSAIIRHTGSRVQDGILTMGPNQVLGKPLGDLGIGYDPMKHFTPPISAGVGNIFLSSLNTPCKPAQMPFAVPQKRVGKKQMPYGGGDDAKNQPETTGGTDSTSLSPSQATNMYLEYLINSDLILKSGRIALANGAAQSSQASPISVVNLHRPCAMRQVRIDATRLNAPPELPKWLVAFNDSNSNTHTPIGDVLIDAQAPQISADNRKLIYRVKMQQDFALKSMPNATSALPVGCVPYRTAGPQDVSRQLPSGSFIDPAKILL